MRETGIPETAENREYVTKSGYTLVEVLISMGILLIFMGILFGLYIYGVRSWKTAQLKMDTSQAIVLAITDISKELHETSEDSLLIVYYNSIKPLSVDNGKIPSAPYCTVSFLTPIDNDRKFHTGDYHEPVFQAYILYYINPEDKTLRKKRIDLPAPGLADPVPYSGNLGALLDGDGEKIASNVEKFQFIDCSGITNIPTRFRSNPLRLRAYIETISTNADKPEKLELERIIRMFN